MLREKVWFKNIHTAVEQAVKNCFACQVATPTTTREPLQMSDLPQEPWSKLSADFGHLPDGTYLLVVTDEYSRYVVVDTIKSTSARAVIPRFDKIFAEFGIPDELKTDNGPPFNGIDFKTYLEHMGIKHRKITPRWPQANAETDRFMRTIKKTIKAAQVKHKNWKQEMFKFLLAYRTTKHSSTDLAPANVLFNRVVKNKLFAAPIQTDPINTCIRCNDAAAKAKMKHYADCKSYIKRSDIQIGESVLVKQSDTTKPTTPYEPIPYMVSNKKESMITAKRHNKSITRNSSFFKKSLRSPTFEEEEREMAETESDPQPEELESAAEPEPDSSAVPAVPAPIPHQLSRSRRTRKMPERFKDFSMKRLKSSIIPFLKGH
ncbi:transposon ty3-g Gag-Pol polyprotein [Plakobranchus ocellatus]|uniref:Transposon ty3-g Gag-Pol polyprotein n=1 Tax=Plakobranchus ocellatus TaxID=259542 RepID=A0AAV3XXH7_9GAST|nr:transposon ty3-g Gag-Pol polyprotein [Plakobranchus ocellatus]